jgi:uncharacterized membrane protein YraQ (UPF0718 family)/regulator of protease activity HflC (stomatin/prohibitin superfamily)
MTELLTEWFEAIWMVLAESGPYLLVGFAIAGFLAVFVPTRWVARRLGGDDTRSVATAAIIGVPVPLCSCSVIPTATQLRRSGASRGATTSFLIATPETGVDSIGATWALMDPLMTVIRPMAAFITAFASGVTVNLFGGEGPGTKEPGVVSPEAGGSCCSHAGDAAAGHEGHAHDHGHDHDHVHDHSAPDGTSVAHRAMRYAFGTLLDDLTPWFILGFAISATIVVAVPDGFFEGTLFTGWTAMLAMLVAGVPLYVCATASTPIAAAMMAKGLEPGAALVFLLAGPATNVATILVVRDLLGMRALVSYLGSIAVVSLLLGTAVNAVYPALGFDPRDMDVSPGAMEHGLVSTVSGVVLAALLLRSAIKTRVPARFGAWVQRAGRPIGLDLTSMPARIALGTGATALYLSSSLTSVGPGETVFIERFGRVAQEHSAPGLIVHAPWPIDSTARVSTSLIRSVEFGIDRVPVDDSTVDALALMAERRRIAALEAESETLTSDGLLLSVRFGAQYRVQDARRWRYGQSDPEDAVSRLAQDALRRAVAVRTAEEVLVGASGPFIEEVERRLTADLERNHLGASLVRVFLHDVHAPPAVHDAYRAVASAMEDAITAEKKAQVSRVERLSQARAEALRVRSDALADRLEEEASATGVASAFKALVEVHGEHPSITEQSLLTDSFERAMRPADDGSRRVVLPLSDNIEIIPLVGSDSPPPPPVLDESFNPRR